MSEKLSAKQYAEQLLYKPAYAADKQADVKQKATLLPRATRSSWTTARPSARSAAESEQMLKDAGYKQFDPKKTYHPAIRSTSSRSKRLSWLLPSAEAL